MSGTKEGGISASNTNKARHGEDFYIKLGRIGGRAKNPNKGFGSMTKAKRIAAGRKGGSISRPGTRKKKHEDN